MCLTAVYPAVSSFVYFPAIVLNAALAAYFGYHISDNVVTLVNTLALGIGVFYVYVYVTRSKIQVSPVASFDFASFKLAKAACTAMFCRSALSLIPLPRLYRKCISLHRTCVSFHGDV